MHEVKQHISEYLKKHQKMTLATVNSPNNPVAHSVEYVSEGADVYFATMKDTQKAMGRMPQLVIIICLTIYLSIFACGHESGASEKEPTRYDAATKSCRILGFDSRWYGKGRQLFDQKCKVCHTRANNVGAPFLYTESLPSRGWNRVFYKKNSKCAKNGSWKTSLDEELLINDYLYHYGANTYDPNCEL